LRQILFILGWIAAICLLTALTQVGGVVLLLCIPLFRIVSKKLSDNTWLRRATKWMAFAGVYCLFTAFVVPPLASLANRVPLPDKENGLVPLTNWTTLLNRHYVDVKLYAALEDIEADYLESYPDASIAYLDANFPFFDGFPLLPHLSHNDGRKLDLAFAYTETASGTSAKAEAPSFIGYGVYEAPKSNEDDQPASCEREGAWQYSILQSVVPQGQAAHFKVDETRTRSLINAITNHPAINKVFLEPHLKTRWQLSSSKIRYHGCQAVRHDDHIHLQL